MNKPATGATATFDTTKALQDAVGCLLERTNVFTVDTATRTISGSHATIASVLRQPQNPAGVGRPVFVLHRLIGCVDGDESSDFNRSEYHLASPYIPFPERHRRYPITWCGMEVGLTTSRTEILTFAEYHPSLAELESDEAAHRATPQRGGMTRLKCISRLSLERANLDDQASQVLRVLDLYRPQAFAMDTTGVGLPLFRTVREAIGPGPRLEALRGYNFAAKLDEQSAASVLEYATDTLRQYVDMGRLLLPYDRDLVGQFSFETFRYADDADSFGRRRRIFSPAGPALNAARMAVMGHATAGRRP